MMFNLLGIFLLSMSMKLEIWDSQQVRKIQYKIIKGYIIIYLFLYTTRSYTKPSHDCMPIKSQNVFIKGNIYGEQKCLI